jgi:threonine dehydrogenase-like Zn-dependent dehydrogenase
VPNKSKAAVLTGPRTVELQEFDLPEVHDDDGILQVEVCGICGADVPAFQGRVGGLPGMRVPLILGHEIAGRIYKVGPVAAERWGVKEGDRVILERWLPCGHCDFCYDGDYRLCGMFNADANYGGTTTEMRPSLWGGYAEYMYLDPRSVIYKVADHVPAAVLPLFTPIANGITWATVIGGAKVGSKVVIQGPGQEGLGATIAAKEAGASQIIVIGLAQDDFRLNMARKLGATHTLVADREDDVIGQVKEITGGTGANTILNVTSGGAAAGKALVTALDLAAQNATIVTADGGGNIENFPAGKLGDKTLTLRGVRGRFRSSVKAAINIMESGKYPLEDLCTHHYGLEDMFTGLRQVSRELDKEVLHVAMIPHR